MDCKTRLLTLATALVACLAAMLPSRASVANEPTLWQSVHGLFTWNHGQAGVYPIFEVDVGRKNSAGAALFLREAGLPNNDVRLSLAGGLDGLFEVHALDRLALFADDGGVAVRAHYRQRPDGLFYGLGGESRPADKTVFELREPEVSAALDRLFAGVVRLQLAVAFRAPRFDGSNSSSSPSLEARFGGAGQPPVPAGFDGYELLTTTAAIDVDSRGRGTTGSGARLSADVGYALDPTATATRFMRWGGEASAFWDVSGGGHLLGVAATARLTEKLGSSTIPFAELVSLGGRGLMRGFLPGRLRGDSAFVGSLFYQQPLGRLVEGQLFVELGNVFPGRLREVDPTNLYGCYGLRLDTTFSREVSLGLLAGFGTTRVDASDFDAIDDVRLNLAVNHRF